MAVAPEPYLSACLDVLDRAILSARVSGWLGQVAPEHLADLMTAVHNIPFLLRNWEKCNLEWQRNGLARYGEKWREHGGMSLVEAFDAAVARG